MRFNLDKSAIERKYFYTDNDVTYGPFQLSELLKKVKGNTLVYREGIDWTKASELEEFKEFFKKEIIVKKEIVKEEIIKEKVIKVPFESTNKPNKTSKIKLVSLLFILAVLSVGSYYIYDYYTNIYPFRILENEKRIIVNKINIREYPDAESPEIAQVEFGARLVLLSEESKKDINERVWNKVRVIGEQGWDKSFEGWIVTKQSTIPWVGDTLIYNRIKKILGNEEAHFLIDSKTRFALLNFLDSQNLNDDWKIYGSKKNSEINSSLYFHSGLSENDINNKPQDCFIGLLQNKKESTKQLLMISFLSNGKGKIAMHNNECNDGIGLKILNDKINKGLYQKLNIEKGLSAVALYRGRGNQKYFYYSSNNAVYEYDESLNLENVFNTPDYQ